MPLDPEPPTDASGRDEQAAATDAAAEPPSRVAPPDPPGSPGAAPTAPAAPAASTIPGHAAAPGDQLITPVPGATPYAGHHPPPNPTGGRLAVLTLTALGVVYGDIGTSPLYAVREVFKPEYGLVPSVANVRGMLSLIV